MPFKNRYFVIGTDTGVGKTVLSLILMRYFYAQGRNPFYLKPFQTGCKNPYDRDSDADFIYGHIPQLKNKDPADSVIYCYRSPKAPFFAARDEGMEKEIDIRRIRDVLDERSGEFDPVILEAAGGLLLPVTQEILMVDMVKMLDASPVIAARAGLGTINHTLLTLEALRTRGIRPLGIVLMDSPQHPTDSDMIRENIEAIERVSKVKVGGVIPGIKDLHCPDPDVFHPIANTVGRLSD